jgi:hypothetical protein
MVNRITDSFHIHESYAFRPKTRIGGTMLFSLKAAAVSRFYKLGAFAFTLGIASGSFILAVATAQSISTPAAAPAPAAASTPVGLFESHGDYGITPTAGNSVFDAGKKTYAITGGGNNLWAKVDAFQFAWKKLSGDFSFSADIDFMPNTSATPDVHRKACLMVRQTLDADSPYIDAARHGNGLTALQFRDDKGGITREVQSNIIGPTHLRLDKHGDSFTLFVGSAGADAKYTGCSYTMKFTEPFYLGLAVSAHNAKDTSLNLETVAFSNVELKTDLPATTPKLYSTIETQVSSVVNATQSQTTDRTVQYVTEGSVEGPVWLPENSGIIFSSGGKLMRLPIRVPARGRRGGGAAAAPAPILGPTSPTAAGDPVVIDTGTLTAISRVHGLTPDGKQIIFVDHPQGTPRPPANTYLVPLPGGTPKLLTPNTGAGSTLSPDGKTFVYDMDTTPDIFTISTDGSAPATRLTNNMGKNYGPQFSHDGKFIFFCSDRSGTMQIWKMKSDGSEPAQLTNDDNNNWFPHLSSNDGSVLFVTYPKTVTGDMANSDVQIRRLNLGTGALDQMGRVVGGPASAPSWSPNNMQITFVSYRMVY